MSAGQERLQILEMIERGQISAEEAVQLLNALDVEDELDASQVVIPEPGLQTSRWDSPVNEPVAGVTSDTFEPAAAGDRLGAEEQPEDEEQPGAEEQPEAEVLPRPGELPAEWARMRNLWWIPLWTGVGVIVLSGALMYLAMQNAGLGFWFACSSVPFTFGMILLIAAWQARTAPWLHLRVEQKPGEWPRQIVLHIPLPLHLAAWFLRTFGHRFSGLKNTSLDEMILAVEKYASTEEPLYIEVEDDEDGEKVQILIG